MIGKIGSSLANAGRSALGQIGSSLEEISTSFTNIFDGGKMTGAAESTTDLVFPIEMAGQPRPCVCFTCFTKIDNKPVELHNFFPTPGGITFSDSASYTELDLGAIGGAAAAEIQQGVLQGQSASQIAGNIASRISSVGKEAVGAILKNANPYADQISLATRTVKNPNTNVIFKGHGVRSFSFTFKMIAKSEGEAELIRQIHERFRHYSYAELVNEATGFMLAYPPVWVIRFYTPNRNGGFEETSHIPRIFSCYLEGVTTNVNASSVTFYRDGAPTEVDISLSFKETRALTRKDIIDMEQDKLKNRGIDPATGRPLLSQVVEPPAPQTAVVPKLDPSDPKNWE